MKYRLLTKEQFEALHQEFATFLAVQEIDKIEWERIKAQQTERVDELLQQFSDLVWESVLNKAEYLEHFSKDSLNLFRCTEKYIERIVVRVENENINLMETAGFDWFVDHSNDPSINYFKGKKDYALSRNEEIFKLIESGSVLSDEKLFNAVSQMIANG